MNIKELLSQIKFAEINADYADVRVEKVMSTSILYQSGELKQAIESPSLGAFLRVLKDGKWAFKSTTNLRQLQDDFRELVKRVQLLPPKDTWSWPEREPLSYESIQYAEVSCAEIPLKEKREFCEGLLPVFDSYEQVQGPGVWYIDFHKEKWFRASDGVEFHYDYNHAAASAGYALKEGDASFEDSCEFFFQNTRGELAAAQEKLKKRIEDGIPFIHAPAVTPGKYKVVLDSEVAGVFTHESFGHKSEADFMLGNEAMKREWEIGKKVASEKLTIIDCGNWPNTGGHVPIDDEGNIKQKTYLIKDGILTGRLHSTATATALNEMPTGNARAMNFEYEPIVRMTNTYIEKGDKPFDELIRNIDEGLYLVGYNHGMGMSTFTIAPRRAYWIKNGKIAEPVKVAVISGNVFETLNLIEDIGNDFDISSGGACGKMEQCPLHVADGGPTIVVSEMTVS